MSVILRQEDLHASVSDPVLDTMNFLNEVTIRYPAAISFAPGRPYDGFFDVEQMFTYIRGYLDHLAAQGYSPGQIRGALFQYGPTAGQIRELIADSLRVDEHIVVPDHSNPAGTTMPLETRRELLATAARHGVLIIEDSPYRMVSPAPHLPTLKSLDDEAETKRNSGPSAARAEVTGIERPKSTFLPTQ